MQIFAICCLVVIVITTQHLLNWGWRKLYKHNIVILWLINWIAFLITWFGFKYIIIWTYPLLNK